MYLWIFYFRWKKLLLNFRNNALHIFYNPEWVVYLIRTIAINGKTAWFVAIKTSSYIHRQNGKVGRTKSKRAKDEGGEGGREADGDTGGEDTQAHRHSGGPYLTPQRPIRKQRSWWCGDAGNPPKPASLSIDHTHRCQIRSPSFLS